ATSGDGLIVASAPIEEAVGADLLYLAHLRLLLAAVGDLALELLKRRQLGQRVRICVGPGDVDEADAVIEQEGCVAQTGWLGALELVVDGSDAVGGLLGAVGLYFVSGNHLVHLRASSIVVQECSPSFRDPDQALGRGEPGRSVASLDRRPHLAPGPRVDAAHGVVEEVPDPDDAMC